MKWIFALIVSIGMLFSLTGCAKEEYTEKNEQQLQQTQQPTNDTEPEITAGEPEETEPEATEPEETEFPVPPETMPGETEPEETQPQSKLPYLENIQWADQPIYSGPGYDYDYVQTVGIAGSYTIVEESYDDLGHLWGKLKSGIGWVDLTNARYADGHRGEETALITAFFAEESAQGDVFYLGDETQYAVAIGFAAAEELDFQFCQLSLEGESYQVSQALTRDRLGSGETFVAKISFPGDMTTYGMIVTDTSQQTHYYAVYISGKDGSLICTEYTP